MPNIAKVLREEISRIARREAKVAVTTVRKSTSRVRPDVADLKNRVTTLEKEVKRLNVLVINLASTQPAPSESPEKPSRILGKGIRSLRRKLGLSQKEFGQLAGVSIGAVTQWERKSGALKLRGATKAALLSIRGIGKAEARKRLDQQNVRARRRRK
jgi:DNA-binding transcriptional regulator YiaG